MDKVAPDRRGRSGRGILGWTAFLVLAVLATAAIIAGTIRAGLSPDSGGGAKPSLSGAPSPSPTPLPKPGRPPTGALIARL
jgi:hypothetical protein